MNELHIFNCQIYEKYKLIKNYEELSCPLLVCSNQNYLQEINNSNNKILYVGEETNSWLNYNSDSIFKIEEIENTYYEFLRNDATNREFWNYIKKIIGNENKLINNVIWTNSLIAGKKDGIGHPEMCSELKEISIEYLVFLYNYFKPKSVILTSGPKNPYYDITIEFLKQIKSNINNYPTLQNNLIIDKEKNIFWTYHPAYQNRKGFKNKNIEKIKKLIYL